MLAVGTSFDLAKRVSAIGLSNEMCQLLEDALRTFDKARVSRNLLVHSTWINFDEIGEHRVRLVRRENAIEAEYTQASISEISKALEETKEPAAMAVILHLLDDAAGGRLVNYVDRDWPT